MAKLETTISINAPVEKIFGYVSEPSNLPEIWPSLMEVKNVQRIPNGGTTNDWVYKMVGMRLQGTSEDVEYVANQHFVAKTKGGVQSTQTWTVQPEAGRTKVTFEVEYTVPIPVLGKLAEAIIVKMNDREGDLILANLKARMEA